MILVTGGCGFIGSALVKALVARGKKVRVFDDISRGRADRLRGVDVEIVSGDIRNLAQFEHACMGVNEVIHLAFINGTKNFYEKPEVVLDVGVRGMLNVLDAMKKQGVGKLLLASSSEVYQTPPTIPTGEQVPLSLPDPYNPRYSYAAGKIISEMLSLYARHLSKLIIVRPHNVYGPDMGEEHVIPELARKIARGDVVEFVGDAVPTTMSGSRVFWGGTQTRAFCYIDDAVDGILIAKEKGNHREIYNVGNDEEVSIIDLAKRIAALGKGRVKFSQVETDARVGGTLRRCPDISKLRALGYAPKVSLNEGLGLAMEWYREAA